MNDNTSLWDKNFLVLSFVQRYQLEKDQKLNRAEHFLEPSIATLKAVQSKISSPASTVSVQHSNYLNSK